MYNFEEKLQSIKELLAEANKLTAAGVPVAASASMEDATDALNEYNTELRHAEFDKWLAEDVPMLAAVTQAEIDQIRFRTIREKGAPDKVEIHPDNKRVVFSLKKFIAYANEHGMQVTASELWYERLMYFKRCLDGRLMVDLCTDQKLAVDVNEDAVTNNKLVANGQMMIDRLLFKAVVNKKGEEINEYVFERNADLAYLLNCMSGKGKKVNGVSMVREDTLCELLVRVMHRIVTNKKYEVEFKTK